LFFLVDAKAGETVDCRISGAQYNGVLGFKSRANVHFAVAGNPDVSAADSTRLPSTDTENASAAFQMEGPAWENDLIGFRNYYDARNGMDIFGKRTPDMVLHSVGLGDDYHSLQDWGMDILKVGTSLGAGSIALAIDDEVHRIGPDSKGTFKMISNGPLRAIFDLDFTDWELEGTSYNVKHRIIIEAGKRYYHAKVWVDPVPTTGKLVTGLVNLHADSAELFNSEHDLKILASYDTQAFDGEYLGMAVLAKPEAFATSETIWTDAAAKYNGITNTFLIYLNLENSKPTEYLLHAGWEKETETFQSKDGYLKELNQLVFADDSKISIRIKQPESQ